MRHMLMLLALAGAATAKNLAPTPPMGWMNWEIFRCNIDCAANNTTCVNEYLFKVHTDRLARDGYLAAGYDTIHIDDCWMMKSPPRTADGLLTWDPDRFPSGMKALGDYMHARGVKFGTYTAESPTTCAGYPASSNNEDVDAKTFASWGVDYLKVDGCGDKGYYEKGYPAMGQALQNSGRDIVYSCSWPAYLGEDETTKTACYNSMIANGCNLWRNWADIQCNWGSLHSIIEHYGKYGEYLQQFAAPGHWNDMDMLLVGNDCINDDEARSNMAVWSVMASPLIMGNDLRLVSASTKAILLNTEAIAVNQDALGLAGKRVSGDATTGQVWARTVTGGRAVALHNPTNAAIDVTLSFAAVELDGAVKVRDIWQQKDLGSFTGSYTTTVAPHGSAFVKLTQ